MKTTKQDVTGIAIEKSWDGLFAAFVNGKMLRTPVLGSARWFKTEALAIKAAKKAVAS